MNHFVNLSEPEEIFRWSTLFVYGKFAWRRGFAPLADLVIVTRFGVPVRCLTLSP
jgi:hypothetical protein